MNSFRHYWVISLLFCLAACQLSHNTEPIWVSNPVDLVRPLMGTQSSYALSTGNTYPAIAAPWGMHAWTPQTGRNGDGWTYTYTANKLVGLKLTHQPSPWINDYGCFSLFPVNGELGDYSATGRGSWFSHKAEKATPYFYSVYLADYDITASLAPTSRACILQMRYPLANIKPALVIDLMNNNRSKENGHIEVHPENNTLFGYTTHNHGGVPDNFRNYFSIELNCPIEDYTITNEGLAIVYLKLPKDKAYHVVEARVGASFISREQAQLNLSREIGSNSFEQVKEEGKEMWNRLLSRVEISGGTTAQQETFYSCLYRSLLFPRSFHEYDAQNRRVHYSPYNGEVKEGYLFTDTGFWDTFRSLFPLLNLLYPSQNLKMQEGLVNAYLESGFLPEWASPGHRGCMVGNNSASVVADGYLKRVNWLEDSLGRSIHYPEDSALIGYSVNTLYHALVKASENVHPTVSSTGRLGHQYYNDLGYIPYDVGINESVARTLEYAYDDWCNAQLGKAIGAPLAEVETYTARSQNYHNVFDSTYSMMRGRNADGSFQSPFSPYKWGDAFTEGNAWHYTWSVFHDIPGLRKLMGGEEGFKRMLDSVFVVPPIFDCSYYNAIIHEIREMQIMNMGNYAHGNQPIQHMIYLYNWTDQPKKVGELSHLVMDRFYSPTPDGYCGDEDNGQTSAWYVFSALGFYPVCPADDAYAPGLPLFPQARLHLENGKTLTITPDEKAYPQLRINGNVPKELTHRMLITR